jgi:hypothetical protein
MVNSRIMDSRFHLLKKSRELQIADLSHGKEPFAQIRRLSKKRVVRVFRTLKTEPHPLGNTAIANWTTSPAALPLQLQAHAMKPLESTQDAFLRELFESGWQGFQQ